MSVLEDCVFASAVLARHWKMTDPVKYNSETNELKETSNQK